MNFEQIDWNEQRPTGAEFDRDWQATQILDLTPLDQRLVAIREALSSTLVNGGALLARFSIDAAPAVRWVLSRNRASEYSFFGSFFAHPTVRTALSDIGRSPKWDDDTLAFSMEAPFVACGQLAHWILSGGAYRRFEGPESIVRDMVSDFADAAFAGRYRQSIAYRSHAPWSLWFHGIAWDGSFIFFDKQAGIMTVLLATDTD